MSCNRDGRACRRAASVIGQPDAEGLQMTGRHRDQCPQCGAYLRSDGGCTRCENRSPVAIARAAMQQRSPGDMTLQEYEYTYGELPFGAALQAAYSRYATNISHKPRQVEFVDRGTAATDLKGKITVNPTFVASERSCATITDHVAWALGALEHEILHELYTPRQILEQVSDFAAGIPGDGGRRDGDMLYLGAKGKAFRQWNNFIEDSRIERISKEKLPGVWQRIYATHHLSNIVSGYDEPSRLRTLSPTQQVQVAMVCDIHPAYALTPEMWDVLDSEAQATLKEILPIAQRGVTGTADEAYQATVEIFETMDRRGMWDTPPSFMNQTQPHGGEGADGQMSAGGAPQSSASSGPTHCPKCGQFLGADGACTNCEYQAPTTTSSQAGATSDMRNSDDEAEESPDGGASGAGGAPGEDQGDSGEDDGGTSGATDNGGGDVTNTDAAGTSGTAGDDQGDDTDGQAPALADGEVGESETDDEKASDGDHGEDDGAEDAGASGNTPDEEAGDDGAQIDDSDTDGGPGAGDESKDTGDTDGMSPDGADPDGGDQSSGSDAPGSGGSEGGSGERRDQDGDEPPPFMDAPDDLEGQTTRDLMDQARGLAESVFFGAEKKKARGREKRWSRDLQRRLPAAMEMNPLLDGEPRRLYVNPPPDEATHPHTQDTRGRLRRSFDKSEIMRGANQLGRQLMQLRTEAESMRRFQRHGDLDRRRLIAGMKGRDNIYRRRGNKEGTSIATSITVDISGSMLDKCRDLYSSLMTTCLALQKADIPFDVSSFSGVSTTQMVTFDEDVHGYEQLGQALDYVMAPGGGTPTDAGILTSSMALLEREETQKLQFVFTDGFPNSPEDTQKATDDARRRGITTLVLVEGEDASDDELTNIFGDQWVRVSSDLREFTQIIGGRVKSLLQQADRRRR